MKTRNSAGEGRFGVGDACRTGSTQHVQKKQICVVRKGFDTIVSGKLVERISLRCCV